MRGFKKAQRTPTSPQADFLYASFDQKGADMQRNRSNSEVGGRKGLPRPQKTTTERAGLRRHTTDKVDIGATQRPNVQAAMWETQIAEIDEDSKDKRSHLRTSNATEWSERLFYCRRIGATRRNLVVLLYEGVLWTGPPASPTAIYRDLMLQGLDLLREHCHVAVLMHKKANIKDLELLVQDHVDAIYASRSTETIGSGKQVWMQNYTQVLNDFDPVKTVFVSCLGLSNDEYEGKAQSCMVAEPFNGNWQFHV